VSKAEAKDEGWEEEPDDGMMRASSAGSGCKITIYMCLSSRIEPGFANLGEIGRERVERVEAEREGESVKKARREERRVEQSKRREATNRTRP